MKWGHLEGCHCRSRRLCNKNVRLLKLGGFLPRDLDVAENYKKYLNPLPEVFDVSDLTDDYILIAMHLAIVKRYLGTSLFIYNFCL